MPEIIYNTVRLNETLTGLSQSTISTLKEELSKDSRIGLTIRILETKLTRSDLMDLIDFKGLVNFNL